MRIPDPTLHRQIGSLIARGIDTEIAIGYLPGRNEGRGFCIEVCFSLSWGRACCVGRHTNTNVNEIKHLTAAFSTAGTTSDLLYIVCRCRRRLDSSSWASEHARWESTTLSAPRPAAKDVNPPESMPLVQPN